jgi:hypothetical protein
VGPGKHRQAHGIGVLLDSRFRYLVGSLVQPGVDDLETTVPKGPGDDLGSSVVAIQAWFGNHDSIRPTHARNTTQVPADSPGEPVTPEKAVGPGEPVAPRPLSRPKAPGARRRTGLLLTMILAVLAAILLLIFVLRLSHESGAKVQAGSQEFSLGRADFFAPEIVTNGPLIFPPLRGSITLYVQHLGANDDHGWLAFDAHDPGQPATCYVKWRPATHDFLDPCDHVAFPADGEGLDQYAASVDSSGDVIINLRQTIGTTPPTSAPTTGDTTKNSPTSDSQPTNSPLTTSQPTTSQLTTA